ncbi:chromate transporter [Mycoplasmopsis gallopavonis]|nr:chromate transporter [Mycoplasmopsis gallopavonis]
MNKKISFWAIFLFILKISFIGFGGGNALMPVIKNEVVKNKKWINQDEFDQILIVTNSLPGASVIQTVSYIAIKLLGTFKGIVVTLIAFIPHLLFSLLIFKLFKYVPIEYVVYIAIGTLISIIILLINFAWTYLKQAKNTLTAPLWVLIFLATFSYNVFVPAPYNIPIIPIIIMILIYTIAYLFSLKKRGKND